MKTHTTAALSAELIWCEPGSFTRTNGDIVTLCGFYLCATPVTQSDWFKVTDDRPSHFQHTNATVRDAIEDYDTRCLPVESISWYEAAAFVARLNAVYATDIPDRMEFMLPTEAQWEYACRAGSTDAQLPYSRLYKEAHFIDNSGGTTRPVRSLNCNEWGFYDMYGNVWEYCRDRWLDRPLAGIDPYYNDSAASCYRCARGGCYVSISGLCTPDSRLLWREFVRDRHCGLRVGLQYKDKKN